MLKSFMCVELAAMSKGLSVKKTMLFIEGPHSKAVIVRKTFFPETR